MKILKKQLALIALLVSAQAIFAMEEDADDNMFARRARSLTPASKRQRSVSPRLGESEMESGERSKDRIVTENMDNFRTEVGNLKQSTAEQLAQTFDKKAQIALLTTYLKTLNSKLVSFYAQAGELPYSVKHTVNDALEVYNKWERSNKAFAQRTTPASIGLGNALDNLNESMRK